eukprot:gene4428-6861_t
MPEDDCCLICAEEGVTLWGYWPCLHRTCWRCALRLVKGKDAAEAQVACVQCNRGSAEVVLSDASEPDWAGAAEHCRQWERVRCRTRQIVDGADRLKLPQCKKCTGWADAAAAQSPHSHARHLVKHYRDEHGVSPCLVCVQGRRQLFFDEHPLYSVPDGLKAHEDTATKHPADEPSFRGHPSCKFCGNRHYDNEALLKHCTTAHKTCKLCDAQGTTGVIVFKSDQTLLEHIRAHHFFCAECHAAASLVGAEKADLNNFVFATEIDLELHGMRAHPKKAKAKARTPAPAARPTPAPILLPADENAVFSIVFCHPSKPPERVYLNEFEPAPPEQQQPPPQDAPEKVRMRPVGGKGTGKGAASKRVEPVRFSSDSGLLVEFRAAEEHGNIVCTVKKGEQPGPAGMGRGRGRGYAASPSAASELRDDEQSVVARIVYEGDGCLKFPEIRRRLRVPADGTPAAAKTLRDLARLADSCGVDHDITSGLAKEASDARQSAIAAAITAPPPVSEAARGDAGSDRITSPDIEEEISTLSAIYSEELTPSGKHPNEWSVRLTEEYNGRPASIFLTFSYPKAYPDLPPRVDFVTDSTCGIAASCSVLPHHLKNGLVQAVLADGAYSPGEPVMFNAIAWAQENFLDQLSIAAASVSTALPAGRPANDHEEPAEEEEEQVVHTDQEFRHVTIVEGKEGISDRKSKFVAHCARVANEEEAMYVVRTLRSIKKIAVAAHPTMWCYRIEEDGPGGGKRVREGRDDDGESGASDKLLFFMQRANVLGYIVVVTRWYGGIHLGSDRFKHILSVAKAVFQQEGVVSVKQGK